jgi:hypothetical protein
MEARGGEEGGPRSSHRHWGREEEVSGDERQKLEGDGDLGHGLPFWPSGMWPCGWVVCFFFTQWNEFKKKSHFTI